MLKEDYDLSPSEIQELSGRTALLAFFARLGYNTNAHLIQSSAAMGFSGDNLKAAINHIERLASQDGGLFEVYLFELKSVTVATTQALVRNFRNRPGDYLLVLTDDYQRLDFVLVERFSPEATRSQSGGTGPLGVKLQVGVRPRVLTVKRTDPGLVAMRVLRRFSYTEGDTFAQYDKLVSAYDVADWSKPYFNNRALFSDYYLTERLPQSADWHDKEEIVRMTRAYRTFRTLYDDVRERFSNQKEAVIRRELLETVLAALGFSFQAGKAAASSEVAPDYRLFQTTKAGSQPSTDASPLALCLTYTWSRNLDGKDDTRDSESADENPGATVVSLLDRGEADWAIVTNGKIWRLYAAKAHSRATNYYEIDLEETLAVPEASRAEAFRYFWLFFRASAFTVSSYTVGGEQRQGCFLDGLISESERYARELGERLKERVFEEIFPHFARGFIIYARRNKLLPANFDSLSEEARAKTLEPFFGGTLTFLYRLLFLLYAESRDLLPVREVRGYYEKSLEKLKRQIADKAGTLEDQAPANIREKYNDLSTSFYEALQELFRAVDKGEAALNVPVYNGGLFVTEPDPADTSPEAETARFLAKYKIPDRELALGLDRMARDIDEKRHDLAFIDYKSLGVRQLGSIYEGLLEFKLKIAPETMAVVKGKKTEEIVTLAEAQQKKLTILKEGRGREARDRTLSKGTVYLENDRRERKATGSYYTPDYIVKYIVENTVGPVLKEKLEKLRPAFRQAEQTLQAEKQKYEALKRQGRTGDSPENQAYLKHRAEVNEPFFDLKVLDPAMGSGHFLVEAVDYITDRLADFLSQFRWNPVVHELTQTRREIQKAMEEQGVSVDASKLTDLNLLKRQVLKRCIYGVDLNPMAVELAKVSLWLDCFTLGAPLSFLDHHLKAGNSLIGGTVEEVQASLQQSLFGNQFAGLLSATSLMQQVGKLSDITVEQVAASRSTYRQAYDALAPFKRLLDVWISHYFGNKGAQLTASHYAGAIVADNYSKTNPIDKKAIETARTLAASKRFFHWQLEFPEVFYNDTERKPDGGFDAVVGNPPYDELSEDALGRVIDEEGFLTADPTFKLLGGGRLNWYHYFTMLAMKVLKENAVHGFIVPMSLMSDQFTLALRKWLLENHQLLALEAFPQKDNPNKRVFFEAKLPTCIYLVRRKKTSEPFRVRIHPENLILDNSPTYYPDVTTLKTLDNVNIAIPQVSEQGWVILKKIATNSRLGKLAEVGAKPTSGEIVFNQQFRKYLTEEARYTLVLRGSHVQRYELVDEAKQGEPVYIKKDLYLNEARPGSKAFDHLKERVVYQEGAAIDNWRRVISTLLPAGLICGHKICYFVDYKISSRTLLGIFSSKLIDWYVTALSTNNSLPAYLIGSLRFPNFKNVTLEKERKATVEELKGLYREGLAL
jgi:hypothetical protein